MRHKNHSQTLESIYIDLILIEIFLIEGKFKSLKECKEDIKVIKEKIHNMNLRFKILLLNKEKEKKNVRKSKKVSKKCKK